MKRIGFILANLNQGMSISMWRDIAREAREHGDGPLFIFPGGRLDYKANNEHLANSIYSMADERSLDGLVIWASALAGTVSMDEARRFVKDKASRLPTVAIGLNVPGVPSVEFDAYSGVKAEMAHLIEKHGERRIAFIRGPEMHGSAERRYQAYLDSLRDAGIETDPRLVTTPLTWSAGEEAVEELIKVRRLVPGKDFTALVAASDQLLSGAYRYLRAQGIRIPADLRIAGFNDNDEDLALLDTRITTVRMPVRNLVHTAFALISGSQAANSLVLPSPLVVRESCGCDSAFYKASYTKQSLNEELSTLLDSESALSGVKSILEGLKVNAVGKVEAEARDFLQSGADIEVLFSAIPVYERLEGVRIDHGALNALHRVLLSEEQRREARERFSSQQRLRLLNEFKTELISAHDTEHVIISMSSVFPRLGIDKCFLFLYEGFSETVLVGGFSGLSRIKGGERFMKGLLAPVVLERELEQGVFIIEPLYHGTEELGYLIISTEETEGSLLEDIRTAVSSSLKGIRLFEEKEKAKEEAERKEKEVREFYVRLSEGLIQPLREITSSVRASGTVDPAFLLSNVLSAENLLDFALAEHLQSGLSKTLYPMKELFLKLGALGYVIESPGELPALVLDEEKTLESFSLIASVTGEGSIPMKVRLDKAGLVFDLGVNIPDKSDASLLIALNILLLHSGSYAFTKEGLGITLPYPEISGEGNTVLTEGKLVFIGPAGTIPDSLLPFSPSALSDKTRLPDNTSSISWRYDGGVSLNSLSNTLSRSKTSSAMRFLCFGLQSPDASLVNTLAEALRRDSIPVCSFGKLPDELSWLKELGEVVNVSALRDLERLNVTPSLLLSDRIDLKLFKEIRERRRFSKIPILLVLDTYTLADAESLCHFPSLLMVNRAVLDAPAFQAKLHSLIDGAPMLPALTGALVKKAIGYINANARNSVSRWKLADAVNISEDYLTRIFHKETGISPWEYLSRYRIQLATGLLLRTGLSISEVASDIGYQDQAYFCRVFKKIKGFPPGKLRQRSVGKRIAE